MTEEEKDIEELTDQLRQDMAIMALSGMRFRRDGLTWNKKPSPNPMWEALNSAGYIPGTCHYSLSATIIVAKDIFMRSRDAAN